MGQAHKQLRMLLGIFVEQSRTIFTPAELNEDLYVESKVNDLKYMIRIVASTRVFWSDENIKSTKIEEQAVMRNLLSNILKQAFRSMSSMIQMGRGSTQKFIDKSTSFDMEDMSAFKAFKASAINS